MADSETLKLIKKALRLFPKVVREKERAAKEREKDIKRFAKLSRQLAKIQAKKEQSQTLVREHAMHVPVSTEHPDGLTHVHEHLRSVNKKQMSLVELRKISESYDLNGIKFPTSNRLEYKRADEFDRLIAIWMDFFNKLFAPHEPMDPDILKALIGSESSFDPDPHINKIAMGLTQVTKETLKILVNSRGEAKAFTFKDIK